MSIRIGVIQFPGSNCERETMLAILRAGMIPVLHLWHASKSALCEMQGFVIIGGFSYEDRSRAGVIAAHDPLMQILKEESEKGKPILGICNGAQILVESGLVPGVKNNQVAMALTDNKRIANHRILGTGYYNAWAHMRLSLNYQRNVFTRHLTSKNILTIPVAHAEGRFVMTPMLLDEIRAQGLHVFQYCDEKGEILSHFPVNPNGSVDNIAAVANKRGNVLAMMPHPERTLSGDPIFASMRDAILEGPPPIAIPLYYKPREHTCLPYRQAVHSTAWIVTLKITDNQAWTVENTLKQMQIPLTVHRKVHWEIVCDNEETLQQIHASEVLYQPCKEQIQISDVASLEETVAILVRPKENLIGQNKQQILKDYFGIHTIQSITYSVIWFFKGNFLPETDLIPYLLKTNLISNPYAHDCYQLR